MMLLVDQTLSCILLMLQTVPPISRDPFKCLSLFVHFLIPLPLIRCFASITDISWSMFPAAFSSRRNTHWFLTFSTTNPVPCLGGTFKPGFHLVERRVEIPHFRLFSVCLPSWSQISLRWVHVMFCSARLSELIPSLSSCSTSMGGGATWTINLSFSV